MPFERARSIDTLSETVAGADIVLSSEAPLTLALDRRVSGPRIGRVAATPRSHASGELVPTDRRSVFFEVVRQTDLPWKTAARALELCLDCWNRTGRLTTILDYPEFDSPATRQMIELLDDIPSSYRALATTQIPADTDVRVIDEPSLTPLDVSILPDDYDTVSPFDEGEATLPEVHLYPSTTAIVDAVVEQITTDNADQIGIVLDQSTPYSPLIEAALEAGDIPYQGGPSFIDDDEVRVFLRLLQSCFAGSGLVAADVRPLLTAAGWDIPRDLDEQRVDISDVDVARDAFDQLERLRTVVNDGTFDDAIQVGEDVVGRSLTTLRDELAELRVLNDSVTERQVNDIEYYLQSFEVPVDRESDGVLLTDAGSTAYVDRPVIFYLGLGEGWARSPPDYPWVDDVTFTENDLRRFKLLLQNGQQRYILAQEARAGDEVTPCPYLRTIHDNGAFETFADVPDATVHQKTEPASTESAFPGPSSPPTPEPVKTLSQSALRDLVISPRDYYFDQLVDTPTNYYMKRGTVLHDAAELYVNAPEWFTDTDARAKLLDEICNQLAPFISDARRGTIRTRLDIGLQVIEAYLGEHPPTEAEYETYAEPMFDNELTATLGVELTSRICERWFKSPDLGGHGIVDLIQDERTIVDYKTGSVKPAATIQEKAAITDIHDYPDFQVLLYLAQHRRERPDETLEMRFVHLLGAVDEMVKGEPPDFEELVSTLTYVPCTFPDFVARREMFDQLTDYADSNSRCKVLNTLGYEQYQDFFEAHSLPREGEDPDQRSAVKATFHTLAKGEVGSYKYVDDGVEKIFADLTEPTGYVLKDDLDAFEEFVSERLDDLNTYRTSRFPVAYGDDDPTWDRVDHRDLILTDDD